MSVSDDIGNLFQRFGGDADRYQEVARDDDAKHAASRWPLLTALDIGHPGQVPGAGRPAPAQSAQAAHAAQIAQAQPNAMPQQAAPLQVAQRSDEALPPGTAVDESSAATSGLVRAPLFARAHRHATLPPPADPARQAATRFSPPPAAHASREERVTAAPVAALFAAHASAAPADAVPAPVAAAPAAHTPAAAARSAPVIAAASAPAAASPGLFSAPPPVREHQRAAVGALFESKSQTIAPSPVASSPLVQSAPQRAASPSSTGSASILSSLFTPSPAAHGPAPAAAQEPRALASVFARLAAAPHRKPGGQTS